MSDLNRSPLRALLVHDELAGDSAETRALAALADALADLDVEVVAAYSAEDGEAVIRSDPSIDVAIVDWDLCGDPARTQELVALTRSRNERLPLCLMTERTALGDVPLATIRNVDEYIYLLDDTSDWIAGRLRDAAAAYRESVLPVMFKALMDFAQTHAKSMSALNITGRTDSR